MSYSYRIDADNRVVFFCGQGTFSVVDLMTCVDTVVTDPAFQSHYNHLIDLRGITVFEPKGADVRTRAEKNHIDKRLNASKIAVVATNDVVFGMSRMYQILMEGAAVRVRVFRNIDEAREWLGLPVDPGQAVA